MIQNAQQHIQNLLPFRQPIITCQFTQDTQLPPHHQTTFPAYIYTLLDRLPPEEAKAHCRILLPESGKTHYKKHDTYQFSLILFGQNPPPLIQTLIEKINQGIPQEDRRPLHQNLKVIALHDGFKQSSPTDTEHLSTWQHTHLIAQRQKIESHHHFRLNIKNGIHFKHSLQDPKEINGKRLIQQLYLSVLYATKHPLSEKTQQAAHLAQWLKDTPLPEIITDSQLTFIHKSYANKQGKHKHLSGYHGTIDISLPPNLIHRTTILELLIINQYLGIGKRTNYGIGQYTLETKSQSRPTSAPKSTPDKPPHILLTPDIPSINQRGQSLFICHQKHAQLSLSENQLTLKTEHHSEHLPLSHIRLILLIGAHHLSTPLIQYCLRQNIDIHYLSHTGKHLGSLNSQQHTNQHKVQQWIAQEQHLSDPHTQLKLSKTIIHARLHNIKATLNNYRHPHTQPIDKALRQIAHSPDLATLRGHEGLATHHYYQQIDQLLTGSPFHFKQRNRRPPKDPFNVLLSLGYSILYHYLNSFILTQGLNPDRGFYHRSQSHSIALCSDLIEPFRHWIERSAITVIRRKQIQPKHFQQHNNACQLNADGRKTYLRHISQMLERSSPHQSIHSQRNIEKIYRQISSLKSHLQHPDLFKFIAHKE